MSPWPGYEFVYLAEHLGYIDPKQVQLIDFYSLSDSRHALTSQRVDVAAFTTGELLLSRNSGRDVQAFYVIDYSNGADVLIANAEIDSIEDLKGKTLGIEPGTFDIAMLSVALKDTNLHLEDLHLININRANAANLLEQGKIDATVAFSPFLEQILARNVGKVLFDSSQAPGWIIDLLAADRNIIQSRPKALQELVQAIEKAKRYAQENPGDAISMMADHLSISKAEFEQALQGMTLPSPSEQHAMLQPNGNLERSISNIKSSLLALQVISVVYPNESYFTDSVIQ